MHRLTSLTKWHVLGLIGVFALGMVAATATTGIIMSGGDRFTTTLVQTS